MVSKKNGLLNRCKPVNTARKVSNYYPIQNCQCDIANYDDIYQNIDLDKDCEAFLLFKYASIIDSIIIVIRFVVLTQFESRVFRILRYKLIMLIHYWNK